MGSNHEEGFLQRLYRKLTTLDERQRFYLLLSIFNVMVLFMIVQALRLRQVETLLQEFTVEVTRLVEIQQTCQQDCKATIIATTFASSSDVSPTPLPITSQATLAKPTPTHTPFPTPFQLATPTFSPPPLECPQLGLKVNPTSIPPPLLREPIPY